MNEQTLKNYAKLLVHVGGNVQKGQIVVINCDIKDYLFARMVEECAYDAGASRVSIDWADEISNHMYYKRASDEFFGNIPQWSIDRTKYRDDLGAVYLRISSPSPGLFSDIDQKRIQRSSKGSATAYKAHYDLLVSGALQQSVCAIPSPAWAKMVYPNLPENEAMDKLWAQVIKGARAGGQDPIADWASHKQNFASQLNYLNQQQFTHLRITTGLGTDLTIGLVKNHIWTCAGDTAQNGVEYFFNIPTEEIFTMPDAGQAEGRVVASMPLQIYGKVVEGFEFTFKNGEVVSYKADKNQDALAGVLDDYEGMRRLGEVALVANSSPIAQMQTLFYNVLFDENASSHLALGKPYLKTIKDGTKLTQQELTALGVNNSTMHMDFMFGTPDMCVVGIKEDGSEIPFFEQGEFSY